MSAPALIHPLLLRVQPFLASLGLAVRAGVVPAGGFLPGVLVEDGGLTVDEATLAYPSDVLHEAGHLAIMTAEERRSAVATLGPDPAMEMAALAWSYAAARHLGIPSRELFHDGYKAGGASLAYAFDSGGGPGVPMLAWWGMTLETHVAARQGVPGFPVMSRWLR